MVLSDRDIKRRLGEDLVIEPLLDEEMQIQPSSVDLRLGNTFRIFKNLHIPYINPLEDVELDTYTEVVEISDDEPFILHPGEFVLGTTLERVEIPPDIVARVEGRSSLGRLAVIVHATAGYIDPGYRGQITLELSNLGTVPVALYPKMRCSQVVFEEMTSPAERPYGAERGSKYQDQEGPIASRITVDKEFDREK